MKTSARLVRAPTIIITLIVSNLLVITSSSFLSEPAAAATPGAPPNQPRQAYEYLKSPQQQQQQPPETQANGASRVTTLRPSQLQVAGPSANPSASTTLSPGQSFERGLIGSILSRAASLNSNQHFAAPSFGADLSGEAKPDHNHDDHDDDDNGDRDQRAASPSQLSVPTDSGEDPLESTTTTSSSSDHLTAATAQNDSIIKLAAQHQPDLTTTATTSTAAADPDCDEQQRLVVDSNSVSAVITAASAADGRAEATASGTIKQQPQPPIACELAYTRCALRKACAPALKAYNDHCQDLINNQTSQCSPKCLEAMIALRSSEEGDDLANCDCQASDYCLASKQRSLLCKPQVDRAVDPSTEVSCSIASWICAADQLCAPALEFYYRNCQSLLSQRHCSARCNNSLTILYRQPKASKLVTCRCDGSEEFPCVKLKTFTERLCLNQGGAAQEDSSDEENSNLTNNPENFVLGAPEASTDGAGGHEGAGGGNGGGNGGTFGDEAEYEAATSKDAGGEESGGYNGIQLVEDNWIPLISGRYFTNLQQQQQQQQQLKQQQQQHKDSHHRKQQATRKAQRNMRQPKARSAPGSNATHHEGKRSRYGRIFMFAAASTSAAHPMGGQLYFASMALVLAALSTILAGAFTTLNVAVNVY